MKITVPENVVYYNIFKIVDTLLVEKNLFWVNSILKNFKLL